MKLKERLIVKNSIDDPMDLPHLFIQNQKVDEFNERVHNAATGEKFSIKAVDSVIGANSAQLRDKILSQISDDPRKTKQIATNLHLCVGERTEIASNVRTDDGMTNGAGNIIKRIQLNHKDKPSGIICQIEYNSIIQMMEKRPGMKIEIFMYMILIQRGLQ